MLPGSSPPVYPKSSVPGDRIALTGLIDYFPHLNKHRVPISTKFLPFLTVFSATTCGIGGVSTLFIEYGVIARP